MSGVTTYEYNTKAGVPNAYVVKHNSQTSGVLPAGSMFSAGTKFAYDGKTYTYEGGADATAVGGPQAGFFAETKNGNVHFFSTGAQLSNNTYFLDTAQGYTVSCFVRGTRLATMDGEAAVEAIAIGDMMATRQGGTTVFRPVTWVGRRRIDLAAHRQPAMVAPILVRRGAFADNVPHRDLLLSPDHAVFVDGKLICVRQLINGSTIRQTQGWTEVEYFHVQLEAHAILVAEGLCAESYLDTGNRGLFSNSGEPLILHPDLTSDADHAARALASCAAFVSDEHNVRPVWQALAERAAALGPTAAARRMETDAALRVVVNGRALRPVCIDHGIHTFALPRDVGEVRLVSNAAAPADARPWLDDRRRLGVNVERIVLRSGQAVQDIAVDHPGLSDGWWAVERDGTALHRWTDGNAVLRLPVTGAPVLLEIRAAASGMMYPAEASEQRSAA